MSNMAKHVVHRTCNSKLIFVTCYLFTLFELPHWFCARRKNKLKIKRKLMALNDKACPEEYLGVLLGTSRNGALNNQNGYLLITYDQFIIVLYTLYE